MWLEEVKVHMERCQDAGQSNGFADMRNAIYDLQMDMQCNPEYEKEGIRFMREGVGIFLDDHAETAPDFIWMQPDLRFNCGTVSFERVRYGKIASIEGTPGAVRIWNNNVLHLLNMMETILNR